jgi:hypothetical protein
MLQIRFRRVPKSCWTNRIIFYTPRRAQFWSVDGQRSLDEILTAGDKIQKTTRKTNDLWLVCVLHRHYLRQWTTFRNKNWNWTCIHWMFSFKVIFLKKSCVSILKILTTVFRVESWSSFHQPIEITWISVG